MFTEGFRKVIHRVFSDGHLHGFHDGFHGALYSWVTNGFVVSELSGIRHKFTQGGYHVDPLFELGTIDCLVGRFRVSQLQLEIGDETCVFCGSK